MVTRKIWCYSLGYYTHKQIIFYVNYKMCETSSWIKSFWYLTKHTYYVINNIMDILTHTIIAVGSLAGFFYAGVFWHLAKSLIAVVWFSYKCRNI